MAAVKTILLTWAALLAVGCAGTQSQVTPTAVGPAAEAGDASVRIPKELPQGLAPARVVGVIDGDTIEVVSDGRRLQVRYIGIDAPEIEHPTRGKDPYAFEAHDANALLVGDGLVFLERDVSDRDDSGRLLRFVWLEDGTLVNARLVEEAFAIVATLPPDVKYSAELRQLQQQAREQDRGLWGVAPLISGECDESYPQVCIQPPPPLLTCTEVFYRDFRVVPPDPHRFDEDNDGTGCES